MVDDGLITDVHQGVPDIEELKKIAEPYKDGSGSLYLLDDAFYEVNKTTEALFTQIGHHHNISIIFIAQRLFSENNKYKTLSDNTHYLVLFPNKRNQSQINTVAHQIAPYRSKYVIDAFTRAVNKKKRYGYLFMDFAQYQSVAIMLRTNIFSWEAPISVFLERS